MKKRARLVVEFEVPDDIDPDDLIASFNGPPYSDIVIYCKSSGNDICDLSVESSKFEVVSEEAQNG